MLHDDPEHRGFWIHVCEEVIVPMIVWLKQLHFVSA
jgi:hypothetical protein